MQNNQCPSTTSPIWSFVLLLSSFVLPLSSSFLGTTLGSFASESEGFSWLLLAVLAALSA
jgi:hypothetical protein